MNYDVRRIYDWLTTSNHHVSNAVSFESLSLCIHRTSTKSLQLSTTVSPVLFSSRHDQDVAGNFDLPDDQMGMEDFEGFEGFG